VPCFLFFSFMFWGGLGGGGFFFFIFPRFRMCLHYVPFKFLICFPILQCFPLSPYHLTFIPHTLENGVLLSPV
jgi:hypothetical protein